MNVNKDKMLLFSKGILYHRLDLVIDVLGECINDPNEKRDEHPDKIIMDCLGKLEMIKTQVMMHAVME